MPDNNMGGITQESIDLTKGIIQQGAKATKAINVASDVLYGWPLEAPSKKLYFIEDAVRRLIPRYLNPTGGKAAHWKVVTRINASKIKAGVAEGDINADITLADTDKSANYKTLQMTSKYTQEALAMGRQFEDIPAYTMLSGLQSLMIQEDRYHIGGNIAALGTPAGLAAADSNVAGSLTGSTAYDFGVSALTIHGWLNGANGINSGIDSADETEAGTLTTFTTGSGKTSTILSWTDIPGAFAYNVYVALHNGTLKYQKTVFANSCNIGTVATGNAPNAGDQTADPLGYDGIVAQMVAGSCYSKAMGGAILHGDGAAGVIEIEDMLQSIWNTARISPTRFLVNAQEARSIKALTIGSSTANVTRRVIDQEGGQAFVAGSAVQAYYSPYAQQEIPILTSVHIPPGKLIAIAERVPYPNAETPNNFEFELQQEYFAQPLAIVDRTQKYSISEIGVLKLYLPIACGLINGIVATAVA